MGWLISLAIILVCLFSGHTVTPDIMFIVAGLFGVAGSISFAATSISSALRSLKKEKTEE